MLNTAILFTALYFLLYKPVNKFLGARKERVQKEMDDAKALRVQADSAVLDIADKQKAAHMEAVEQAEKIQEQARASAKKLIDAAEAEAKRIVDNAGKAASEAVENNKQEMRDFAAALAIDISSKVLSREITDEDQQRLIDEFINEVK